MGRILKTIERESVMVVVRFVESIVKRAARGMRVGQPPKLGSRRAKGNGSPNGVALKSEVNGPGGPVRTTAQDGLTRFDDSHLGRLGVIEPETIEGRRVGRSVVEHDPIP